jgi:hypothetical protein
MLTILYLLIALFVIWVVGLLKINKKETPEIGRKEG